MRTFGIGVLVLALVMALASTVVVGLAHRYEWASAACSIGGVFCDRPLLLFVPVLATLAWGMMLRLDE
jgi:hypothetical protein